MYPDGQQILVIDDNPLRRQQIECILSDEGFAVTAVAQGFSAIRAAASRRFALAIAAVDLPGSLDGASTIGQLRARQPWLKALFVGDIAHWANGPGRICDDFIAAPFHRRELLGGVFELLQREIVRGEIVRRAG